MFAYLEGLNLDEALKKYKIAAKSHRTIEVHNVYF